MIKKAKPEDRSCLINQTLLENSGLDDITCQKAKSGTRISVNKQIFFKVKT